MNYRQFDLNLLQVFDALIAERHVSRAAARIGISQPAMSHALRKLRIMLRDPILIRVNRQMQPTTNALDIAPKVRDILDNAASLTGDARTFEPSRSHRTFVLGMTDYAASCILPTLSNEVRRVAPHVRLVVRHMGRGDGPSAVEKGEVDLALGVFLNAQRLRARLLSEERFLCAVWRGSKAVKGRLSLDKYLQLSHVLVASHGDPGGVVDFELGRRNLQRHIFCVVPHFLVAPAIIRGTDLILTLAESALRDCAKNYDLKLIPPPLDLPAARFEMLWHSRTENDHSMRWLRSLIAAVKL